MSLDMEWSQWTVCVRQKRGKCVCDRTQLSSQNKVSSSFEHTHRHFEALLNTAPETGRHNDWTGKVMRANQQSQHTYISTDRSPGSSMLKCMCALKLEGSNFKVLTSFFEVFIIRVTVHWSTATLDRNLGQALSLHRKKKKKNQASCHNSQHSRGGRLKWGFMSLLLQQWLLKEVSFVFLCLT